MEQLSPCRISGCQVGEKGCRNLFLALESNPAHLRELDLSFNHPGDAVLKLLADAVKDPHWKLETLKYSRTFKTGCKHFCHSQFITSPSRDDHCGRCRLRPSPRRCKYKQAPFHTVEPTTMEPKHCLPPTFCISFLSVFPGPKHSSHTSPAVREQQMCDAAERGAAMSWQS